MCKIILVALVAASIYLGFYKQNNYETPGKSTLPLVKSKLQSFDQIKSFKSISWWLKYRSKITTQLPIKRNETGLSTVDERVTRKTQVEGTFIPRQQRKKFALLFRDTILSRLKKVLIPHLQNKTGNQTIEVEEAKTESPQDKHLKEWAEHLVLKELRPPKIKNIRQTTTPGTPLAQNNAKSADTEGTLQSLVTESQTIGKLQSEVQKETHARENTTAEPHNPQTTLTTVSKRLTSKSEMEIQTTDVIKSKSEAQTETPAREKTTTETNKPQTTPTIVSKRQTSKSEMETQTIDVIESKSEVEISLTELEKPKTEGIPAEQTTPGTPNSMTVFPQPTKTTASTSNAIASLIMQDQKNLNSIQNQIRDFEGRFQSRLDNRIQLVQDQLDQLKHQGQLLKDHIESLEVTKNDNQTNGGLGTPLSLKKRTLSRAEKLEMFKKYWENYDAIPMKYSFNDNY